MPTIITAGAATAKAYGFAASSAGAVIRGCATYTTTGTYTFTVPAGVTSISIVSIAAGGSGGSGACGTIYCCCCGCIPWKAGGGGGAGGELRYKNNYSVSPGQILSVYVCNYNCATRVFQGCAQIIASSKGGNGNNASFGSGGGGGSTLVFGAGCLGGTTSGGSGGFAYFSSAICVGQGGTPVYSGCGSGGSQSITAGTASSGAGAGLYGPCGCGSYGYGGGGAYPGYTPACGSSQGGVRIIYPGTTRQFPSTDVGP